MTTSNPPTAVEALQQAADDLLLLHDWLAEETRNTSRITLAARYYERCANALQALQLHGGGESRSSESASHSLRSVPPDQVPEMTATLDLVRTITRMEHSQDEGSTRGDPEDDFYALDGLIAKARDINTMGLREVLGNALQQALSGGGEAKSKSETNYTAILQGPTREELHQAFDEAASAWAKFPDERSLNDHIIDSIFALLNPTSPWQPIESAPENGTQIMVEYDDGQRVKVYWGCYDNGYSQTGVEGWVMGLSGKHPIRWMPLPALPGGEART